METRAIGARISLFRDRVGMTQTALAKKIGCTSQHISAIERGAKTPKLETFVAIANALRVQPDLLLQDVLDDWQEGWEAELDRVLAAVPTGVRRRVKKEIVAAQRISEETKDCDYRAW